MPAPSERGSGEGRRGPSRLIIPVEDVIHRPIDRRVFITWAGRSSIAGLSLLGAWGLAGCGDDSGNGASSSGRTSGTTSTTGPRGDTPTDVQLPSSLKVGVIAPLEGLGKFVGDITVRSLEAAQAHIDAEGLFPGTTVSYEIVNAPAEELADATTNAYVQLVSDPDVIGILWCSPVGLAEARAQIGRDNLPLISVFYDPWSEGWLYPDGPERSIFQTLMPDSMAMDLLVRYAKEDRGYRSAGFIYDTTIGPVYLDGFNKAMDKHGLTTAGVEEFNIFSADYGAQLQRLGQSNGDCLLVWGLAENTAGIVGQLDALQASYVDTPTAKEDAWRPHVLGSPGGTGEKKWAALAGDAAKSGTLTAWHMGGLIGTPSFPVREWTTKYLDTFPSGGEESPANGYWALLEAVRSGGTTDRDSMITELEQLRTTFAGLEYGFAPDRHLSITEDQLVIVALEKFSGPTETDPPYVLGNEWPELWLPQDPEYAGPVHLVRPTLEANRRHFPDTVQEILERGYGTQCTKRPADASGLEVEMTNDCKIH